MEPNLPPTSLFHLNIPSLRTSPPSSLPEEEKVRETAGVEMYHGSRSRAAGLQSRGTVARIVSSSFSSQLPHIDLLRLRLPGVWLILGRRYCLFFFAFSSRSSSVLTPANTFRGAVTCRARACYARSLWLPERGSAAIYQLKGSCTTPRNVF